jgi:hypothetical protein
MRLFEKTPRGNLFKDLAIILFSVLLAIILVKTGVLENLFSSTGGMKIFGSFIAGLFFTSIFTVAPATVALAEISRNEPLVITVLLGGLGAMLGDLVIFRFVKNSLVEDFSVLIKHRAPKRLASVFKLRFFRWFMAFFGALVIVSPFPDEIGLAMMGLTKVRMAIFIPLSFILNSLGILMIAMIARAI